MRAYTSNELQAIITEAFTQGFQVARALQRDAQMPAPPTVQQIVDHPYHSSDAPGQYKRPWLNDMRGRRGLVKMIKDFLGIKETDSEEAKEGESQSQKQVEVRQTQAAADHQPDQSS